MATIIILLSILTLVFIAAAFLQAEGTNPNLNLVFYVFLAGFFLATIITLCVLGDLGLLTTTYQK